MFKKLIAAFLKPENSQKNLEVVCFWCGIFAMFMSLGLIFLFGTGDDTESIKSQRIAIFIGLWAPTLIAVANYLKKN